MRAIVLRLRSEFRGSWRGWLLLALLLGVAGGASTAAAAGARRTQTAFPRFVEWAHGADVSTGGFPDGVDPRKVYSIIPGLPAVLDSTRIVTPWLAVGLPGGRIATVPEIFPLIDPSGALGTRIERFKVLEGRTYTGGSPNEAVADFATAERFKLSVGDVLRIETAETRTGPVYTPVRLVGVVATPAGFPSLGSGSSSPALYVDPGFAAAHGVDTAAHADNSGLVLRLRGGAAGVPAFEKELRSAGLGQVDHSVQATHAAGVQRSLALDSLALWSLSALIALAAAAVLGQSLARQTYLGAGGFPALRAVGFTRRQLFALGVTRAGIIGAVAAIVTVVVAFLLSPLTPIGLARLAEPNPGFAVDASMFAVGAAAVLVIVPILASLPAWRAAALASSAGPELAHPSPLANAAGRLPGTPAAAIGVRAAFEPGRGRTATPVRSAILGTVLAVAALVAATLFWSSLRHLLHTPRLAGYTWSAFVAPEQSNARSIESALRTDPDVAGYSRGGFINVTIAGQSMFGIITGGEGPSTAVVVQGREPATSREIALGRETMRAAHVAIGQDVLVAADEGSGRPPAPIHYHVVGEAIITPSPFGTTVPGQGAVLTFAGGARVDPASFTARAREGIPFLVTFRSNVDPDVAFDSLRGRLHDAYMISAQQPGEQATVGRIAAVPLALAAILILVAVGTLAQTLVTAVRQRRRELAILKTLGFTQRQVRSSVAWQALTLASIALLVGVPLGIAAGRWGWRAFAERVGALAVPVISGWTAILIPATILLALAVSYVPALLAARTKPAAVLRSE